MWRGFLASLLMASVPWPALAAMAAVAPATTEPAQVLVVSTLHRMHEKVPGYDYQALKALVEDFAPDVVCIEVRADKFAARAPEATKREYPRVLYPLIDTHHYRVYAMEPSEPLFSALAKPYLESSAGFAARAPEKSGAFDAYASALYEVLKAYWSSPLQVNDPVTDSALRAKHDLQQALIGDGERKGWQGWNAHFAEVVERAARENPGKRILVTVGAEHAYWLREHLAGAEGIDLLDPGRVLMH